jgi:small nuclear ribonucleoprotein (snRNP)-like protein
LRDPFFGLSTRYMMVGIANREMCFFSRRLVKRPSARNDEKRLTKEETINMLFYSFFKTLVGSQVQVELKNDLVLAGTLLSVDQFLNIKLDDVKVVSEDPSAYPHMVSLSLTRWSRT